MTVEDVLARRIRLLFLNAPAALSAAPATARLMAKELNRDEAWVQHQVDVFAETAKEYVI